MTAPACRFCLTPLTHTVTDLGKTPLANSYLTEEQLKAPEASYPLHARVCSACFLVQVESVVPPEHIFGHYAYFSSYSASWIEHARQYTETAIARLGLTAQSRVVEVASNDGYLLRHFVTAGIPCLGIEPAENVAESAREIGVPTEVRFFGEETAQDLVKQGGHANLIIANNVLAHVPDLNDFVAGFKQLLAPTGTITVEFPHLLQLIEHVQFDTIYHEHYCYFSLVALERVFGHHGLRIFDVTPLPTHGGSLRIWVQHQDVAPEATEALKQVRALEHQAHLNELSGYTGFQSRVDTVCEGLKAFLDGIHDKGQTIAAYGAAAKGNTLLNVCGIKPDRIPYVVDLNPHKQNHALPGSHLPIYSPEHLKANKPDYVLILPWNLRNEIEAQLSFIRDWGGRFVVAVPQVEVW